MRILSFILAITAILHAKYLPFTQAELIQNCSLKLRIPSSLMSLKEIKIGVSGNTVYYLLPDYLFKQLKELHALKDLTIKL